MDLATIGLTIVGLIAVALLIAVLLSARHLIRRARTTAWFATGPSGQVVLDLERKDKAPAPAAHDVPSDSTGATTCTNVGRTTPRPSPAHALARAAPASARRRAQRIATTTPGPMDPRRDLDEWKSPLSEANVREAKLHDAHHAAATVLLPRSARPNGHGPHGVAEHLDERGLLPLDGP